MTEKKTTVDDIIGLVDCEPIDSVEEVRKLRGRDENNFYWYKKYKEVLNENEQLKEQLHSILKLTKRIEDYTHDIKVIGDLE